MDSAPLTRFISRAAAFARARGGALRTYLTQNAPEAFGAFVAFYIMLVQPLAYQNHYFNINRFKFYMYIGAALGALAVYIVLRAYCPPRVERVLEKRRAGLADAGMYLFTCAAALSCALSASPTEALTGSAGRFSGLILILAMCAVYVVVSRAKYARRALVAGLLPAGEMCALLGVLNFFKIDPMGFFDRLGAKDVHRFISTIGNIDFFGAYLCLFLPAATVVALGARRVWARAFASVCALTGVCAVVVTRADGALIAIGVSAFACALYAINSRRALARSLLVVSLIPVGFALIGALDARFPSLGFEDFTVFYAPLVNNYLLTCAAATALALGALGIYLLPDARTPARRAKVWRICIWCAPIVMLAALITAMWYFTVYDPHTPLTGVFRYLRFRDTWGTFRGGVWVRCLKLYESFSPIEKLFGLGPDMLKARLSAAYGTEIAAYSGLRFDNAHNEYIQYLLTLGAVGLGSYLLFAGACIANMARAARRDLAAAACAAAACAYLVHALISLNQPETTPLLFLTLSACAGIRERRHNISDSSE